MCRMSLNDSVLRTATITPPIRVQDWDELNTCFKVATHGGLDVELLHTYFLSCILHLAWPDYIPARGTT